MLKFAIGAFIVLHGLVHLLYFGQSRRLFELQPGMVWPDDSWAFSKLLGDEATRTLANIACILATVGFVTDGIGIFIEQTWWRPLVVVSAAFSAGLFILFWNGELQKLPDQGWIGIIIDIAILASVLILHWPEFDF